MRAKNIDNRYCSLSFTIFTPSAGWKVMRCYFGILRSITDALTSCQREEHMTNTPTAHPDIGNSTITSTEIENTGTSQIRDATFDDTGGGQRTS